MISQTIVSLLEEHSRELYHRWMTEVRKHPDTPTFHYYPESKLLGHIRSAYSQLGEMLQKENRDRVSEVYTRLGAERFQQGFHLSEILKSFIFARRVLWDFMEVRGVYNSMEKGQAMKLRSQILLFFDRAEFFIAKGFESQASLQKSPL
jgi:hypothetical protein